jgi:hypothetical protein
VKSIHEPCDPDTSSYLGGLKVIDGIGRPEEKHHFIIIIPSGFHERDRERGKINASMIQLPWSLFRWRVVGVWTWVEFPF